VLGVVIDQFGNPALRNVPEVRHGDGEEIERECQRLTMEISTGKDSDFIVIIKKKQGIVSNRVKLSFNDPLRVDDSTMNPSMHLRDTA